MKTRWLTCGILAAGAALRLALAVALPPERAYDDHFKPVEIILSEKRIPSAADCWECYQPPLYYLVSAATFRATEQIALWTRATQKSATSAGRKAIQFVSVAAGCATLWVCWLILQQTRAQSYFGFWNLDFGFKEPSAESQSKIQNPKSKIESGFPEALALAIVAFLPQHIYMSAMATNDALTYLVASLAVWAALRAQQRSWLMKDCLLAGALAGATVLCKGYGWMTVFAIGGALGVFAYFRRASEPPTQVGGPPPPLRAGFGFLVAALAVGIGPHVRNLVIYDRFQIDNFDLFDSPMRFQPPGAVRDIEFFSFRFAALLAHPWLHVSHVKSFWTELYGRFWFDYEGLQTQIGYPPWEARWKRCQEAYPEWNRARWNMLLDYQPHETPPAFQKIAVASYLAGLPLTICVLIGLALALRRFGRNFALTLLALHLVFSLGVPLFQTLRLPYFAAMKAGFTLGALSSVPVFAWLALTVPRGAIARIAVFLLGGCVAVLMVADAVYVLNQFRVFSLDGV